MRQAVWNVLSSVAALALIVTLSVALAAGYAVHASAKPPVYVSMAILQTDVTLPSVMTEIPYLKKYAERLSETSGSEMSTAEAMATIAVVSQTGGRYLLQVRGNKPEQALERARLALETLFAYVRPSPAALDIIEREEMAWRDALANYQRIVDQLNTQVTGDDQVRVQIVQDHAAAVAGSQQASAALLLLDGRKKGLGPEIVAVPPSLPSEPIIELLWPVTLGLFLVSMLALTFFIAFGKILVTRWKIREVGIPGNINA